MSDENTQEQEPVPSIPTLVEMLPMYQYSQAIFALHHLGIPEFLHKHGAKLLSEIALGVNAHADALHYLLEVATKLNVLYQNEEGMYSLTENGLSLCPQTENTLIPLLDFHDIGFSAWSELTYTLKTGLPAFDHVYKTDIYDYFRQTPVRMKHFHRLMERTTDMWLHNAGEYYDFSGHIVDIGGNTGALTALLLQKFPELQATLFDLEQAVNQSEPVLLSAGVKDRCNVVAGSFFDRETIPTNGDIYLISRVLLNWSDEKAVEILQNCHHAMPPKSKLLILDFCLPDTPEPLETLHSLHLWLLFGSRSRRKDEFDTLITEAGFADIRWIDFNHEIFLLEATPM